MDSTITLGKDSTDKFDKSGVVYKLTCKVCNATYVGQTGWLLNTRVEKHKSNFRINGYYHNVVSKHKKENFDHDFDWENVEIFHRESDKCKREFLEMLYIKKEKENSMQKWTKYTFLVDFAKKMEPILGKMVQMCICLICHYWRSNGYYEYLVLR